MTSLNEWVDMKIHDDDINYFEYDEFSNVEKVGEGGFGVVNKADWKSGGIKVALKILANNPSVNEDNLNKFLKELKNLRRVSFHPNINRFFGITKDPLSDNHIMVLEYANQGNLREYLKLHFKSLKWGDKVRMAMDIACGLKCLHSRQIIHRDLHAKNILVHSDKLTIADLGLSKQLLSMESNSNSKVYGMPAYIEPQYYKDDHYVRDKRSDIYSLGVLLWELTSGSPPFSTIQPMALTYKIAMGLRETPVIGTPSAYEKLYKKCWGDDPNLRPNIDNVFNALEKISIQSGGERNSIISIFNIDDEANSTSLTSQNDSRPRSKLTITDNIVDLSLSNLPQIESEHQASTSVPSITNSKIPIQSGGERNSITSVSDINDETNSRPKSTITDNIANLTLSNSPQIESEHQSSTSVSSILTTASRNKSEKAILDEIIEAYLKYNSIGWTKSFNFEKVFRKYKSKAHKISNYLISNPDIEHYEVLLGKFHHGGFGVTKIDKSIAFDWYMKSSKKNDVIGHYEVGHCYYYGYGVEKNYVKAFEFVQLAANHELNIALDFLATCYEYGYGIPKDSVKAFSLYQKSAENGFIPSQSELVRCYECGMGTKENKNEALNWAKKYQESDGEYDVSDQIKNLKKEAEREIKEERKKSRRYWFRRNS